jgi:hypothetical protein
MAYEIIADPASSSKSISADSDYLIADSLTLLARRMAVLNPRL